MAGRWLRNKKDGEIYGWNQILADNPLTEEVYWHPKREPKGWEDFWK